MNRTAEDFAQRAQELGLIAWRIHDCSMCKYLCGFLFGTDGRVAYDAGCYCVRSSTLRPSSWEEVASHYNIQENAKLIANYDYFWGFAQEEKDAATP